MKNKKNKFLTFLKNYIFIFIGAFITAIGLKMFLIPNNIIDGGIIGISIIVSYLTKIPLGVFIFCLNIPFLFFGYKQIGKTFVLSSLFAILSLSFWVTVIKTTPATNELLLACVFGGIILGTGVGIIIRYGGSLDGTEIIAIVINQKSIFSVGQTVMFFNIFILSSAALVFDWNKAMYSILSYFIAFKVIDIAIEGLDEAKAAFIVTQNGADIVDAINARLGRGVTLLDGVGGYTKTKKDVLYTVITRLEISKLKSIINELDEYAFVTITDVADVMGGKLAKKGIH